MQRSHRRRADARRMPFIAPRRARALFVGYLVIQIGIPVALLWHPRPARFGWQMYSGEVAFPSYQFVYADGRREEVDLSLYLAYMRAELDYTRLLPAHLCRQQPAAAAIAATAAAATELVPCSR